MRFSFTGKNVSLSDSLKDRTVQKIGKLEKKLSKDAEVNVIFSVVKQESRIEVTIPLKKHILRAEVTGNDMYSCLDSVVDVLDKQLVKYMTRLRDRRRRDLSYGDELEFIPPGDTDDDNAFKIVRTKRFALKPMDAEEAVMEMELSGHNFYVFKSSATDEVNVVYKRNDGAYGLIEPEY